jgi:hypothetical protein
MVSPPTIAQLATTSRHGWGATYAPNALRPPVNNGWRAPRCGDRGTRNARVAAVRTESAPHPRARRPSFSESRVAPRVGAVGVRPRIGFEAVLEAGQFPPQELGLVGLDREGDGALAAVGLSIVVGSFVP